MNMHLDFWILLVAEKTQQLHYVMHFWGFAHSEVLKSRLPNNYLSTKTIILIKIEISGDFSKYLFMHKSTLILCLWDKLACLGTVQIFLALINSLVNKK